MPLVTMGVVNGVDRVSVAKSLHTWGQSASDELFTPQAEDPCIISGGLIDVFRCAMHSSVTLGVDVSADGAARPANRIWRPERTDMANKTGRAL